MGMYTMLSGLFLFLISREIAHGPEPVVVAPSDPSKTISAGVR
jgi:hypothetical protein